MMNRYRINSTVLPAVLVLFVGCATPPRETKTLWSEGALAFRQKDYATAVDRFSTLLAHPKLSTNAAPTVLYWKARSHLELKQEVEAYRCWKDIAWQYPTSREAKWVKAMAESGLRHAASQQINEATNKPSEAIP